jgi:hypothetical protein
MIHGRIARIAGVAALVLSAPRSMPAQVAVEPPAGGGGTVSMAPPTASAPATTQTHPASTTQDLPSHTSVLQQLLDSGTTPGISEATIVVPPGPELGANGLLREGQQISLRAGRLKKDENGRMAFVFDPKESPTYPPMGVIPSRRLEAMEEAAGFGVGRTPNDMTFRIDAEVTEYRGKNYLYIKPSAIPVPVPPPPAALPGPAAPATVPATALEVRAAAPIIPAAAPLTESSVVSNRVGRLVRDPKTGVELIAFDADGRRMADPPMGVVPCKYLAVLEDATQGGNKPVKFHVSGEVTTYRGKNYLYLRYVGVVLDLNQGIGAGDNLGG